MEVLETFGCNALGFIPPIACLEVTRGQSIKKPKEIIPGMKERALPTIATSNDGKKGGCCFR